MKNRFEWHEKTLKELETEIKFGRKVYFSKDKKTAWVARYYSSVWWNPFDWIRVKILESKPETNKLKIDEFISEYCNNCGSQRCEGVNSEWFEGCKYKDFLNT